MTEAEKKYHNSTILVCHTEIGQEELLSVLAKQGAATTPEQVSWINQDQATVTIGMVRQLTQDLSYSSFRGKERNVIIQAIDKATQEAQNALLKTLEEPPDQTKLWLVTNQVNKLLPTIRSRCYEITITTDTPTEIAETTTDLLTTIPHQSYRELVDTAAQYKDRVDAQKLVQEMITAVHKLLEEHPTTNYTSSLETLLVTETHLNANVNVQLALENAFFQLKEQLPRERGH